MNLMVEEMQFRFKNFLKEKLLYYKSTQSVHNPKCFLYFDGWCTLRIFFQKMCYVLVFTALITTITVSQTVGKSFSNFSGD